MAGKKGAVTPHRRYQKDKVKSERTAKKLGEVAEFINRKAKGK